MWRKNTAILLATLQLFVIVPAPLQADPPSLGGGTTPSLPGISPENLPPGQTPPPATPPYTPLTTALQMLNQVLVDPSRAWAVQTENELKVVIARERVAISDAEIQKLKADLGENPLVYFLTKSGDEVALGISGRSVSSILYKPTPEKSVFISTGKTNQLKFSWPGDLVLDAVAVTGDPEKYVFNHDGTVRASVKNIVSFVSGAQNAARINQIAQFFRDFLGRDPDLPGLTNWVNATRFTPAQIGEVFYKSPESSVRLIAWGVFRREPTAAEVAAASGKSLENIILAMLNSSTSPVKGKSLQDQLRIIYQNIIGQPAPAAAVAIWVSQIQSRQTSIEKVFLSILNSNISQVTQLYRLLFGRPPDSAGLAFLKNALDKGVPFSSVILTFTTNAEYLNRIRPPYENKIQMTSNPNFFYGVRVVDTARTVYDLYDRFGKKLVTVNKETTFQGEGAGVLRSIGVPDVSFDGKYFISGQYMTLAPGQKGSPNQYISVIDAVGKETKIQLPVPASEDSSFPAANVQFVSKSSTLIEVAFFAGGKLVYNVKGELVSVQQVPPDILKFAKQDMNLFNPGTPVTRLANYQETAFSPAISGAKGFYKADILGTNLIAWGVLDVNGKILQSGLATKTDGEQAVAELSKQWALFNTGKAPSGIVVLGDADAYLTQQQNLSADIRFFFLKGVLDLYAKEASRFETVFNMAAVFNVQFSSLKLSEAQIQYLVTRILTEWKLSGLPQQDSSMAFNFHQIYYGLFVNARDRQSDIIPFLIRDVVDKVMAGINSDHLALDTLIRIASDFHLKLDTDSFYQSTALPGRDPKKLFQLLQALEPDGVASYSIIKAFYDLIPYLEDSPDLAAKSLEKAESFVRSWVSKGLAGQNLFWIYPVVAEIFNFSGKYPDIQRFAHLDAETRNTILMLILQRFSTAGENHKPFLFRFLVAAYESTVLSNTQRLAVGDFLNARLPELIQNVLASPVPPTTGHLNSFYVNQLNAVLWVSKTLDKKEFVDPILNLFLQRFMGEGEFPAESSLALEARRNSILEIWHKFGVFFVDRVSIFARDPKILEEIQDYLQSVGPFVGRYLNFVDIYYTENPMTNNGAEAGMQNAQIFFGLESLKKREWLNQYRLSFPETLDHEIGHVVHNDAGTPDFNYKVATLYMQSVRDNPDYFADIPWYASRKHSEDAAVTFHAFNSNNKEFFDRAVVQAQAGNFVLMQKYLLWAGLIGRKNSDGTESFSVYKEVTIKNHRSLEQGGNWLNYSLVGTMQILERDSKGWITKMSGGGKTYIYEYEGNRLVGVKVL